MDAAPPPLRTAKHILLVDASGPEITRSRPETIKVAGELVLRLRGGADFEGLAREYSQTGDPRASTILGTFAPEMLSTPLDHFLFSAAVGDISDPLEAKAGVYILQRVETFAAVLQIHIAEPGAAGRTRCLEILKQLEQGAEFGELARQHSADKVSAARGGQFAIYERGPKDTLLKDMAFRLEIGDISAPVESSIGWHLLKRVALDALDPALATPSFVRLRAILVRFDTAAGADRATDRTQEEARKIVDALHTRIAEGAEMRSVAREFNDDPGGKEREGDLGWIYRNAPNLGVPLRQGALLAPGALSAPALTAAGYLIVKREK
jgi:parvulin-like peptidyl-prolyl isomerase